jgi:hypothetical protein
MDLSAQVCAELARRLTDPELIELLDRYQRRETWRPIARWPDLPSHVTEISVLAIDPPAWRRALDLELEAVRAETRARGLASTRYTLEIPGLPGIVCAWDPAAPAGVVVLAERAAIEAWSRDCAPPPGSLGVLILEDQDGTPVAEADLVSLTVRPT